jgi:NAD(P)-dependent dehydrogenase (short-subunit alcohol dehydrogenase family)
VAAIAATRSALGATGPAGPASQAGSELICVLGASGNVGNAIVRELLAAGHRVVAVSRSADKLEKIRTSFAGTKRIETHEGDVSSDAQAVRLRDAIIGRFGKPHAVVASLSAHEADVPMRILATSTEQLKKVFDTNFFTHVTAANAFIPALARGGVYVGINGGLADFVIPNRGQLSMTQSALRTLYSVLAQEAQDSTAPDVNAHVRMLGLYGLVATESNRAKADDGWITDQQVGERVARIIAEPAAFPGPVLSLKAKRYS